MNVDSGTQLPIIALGHFTIILGGALHLRSFSNNFPARTPMVKQLELGMQEVGDARYLDIYKGNH